MTTHKNAQKIDEVPWLMEKREGGKKKRWNEAKRGRALPGEEKAALVSRGIQETA